jgi:PAS domain S-box-containing protein
MVAEFLRILILEDNPVDAELIQFELQEAGFTFNSKVVMAEEDFIREIQGYCPDLILSDYDLPRYNGALALAEARRSCPNTPFILVTGAVSEDRAIEILTQGAKDYVLKNRLQQRLAPAVRRALAEAEELKARKKAEEELREAHRTLEERVKTRTAELEAEMTARVKMEEALRESENRERQRAEELATILDAVPTPVIIVHDVDSTHMTGNRTADELLQQSHGAEVSLSAPSEVKPRHFRAIKDGRELRLDELPAQRAAKGEHVQNFEFSLVFTDGTTRYVLGYGTPLLDKQQHPRGAVHVLVDITERRRAEQALQDSEKRYRRLFESSMQGILILDADTGKVLDVNPFLLQLIGHSYDELCGQHIWELGVFNNIVASKDAFNVLQDNEFMHYDDLPLETHDGQPITVEFISNLYQVDHQKVIQCNIRNITKRKQAEEALHRSEEWYRTLFNTMIEGFCIIEVVFDNEGKPIDYRFLEINPAFEEQTGLHDAKGKLMRDLAIEHEAHWFEIYGKIAITGEPARFENEAKALNRWFEVSAFRIGGPESRKVAVLFNDITKRKQMEEELSKKERSADN